MKNKKCKHCITTFASPSRAYLHYLRKAHDEKVAAFLHDKKDSLSPIPKKISAFKVKSETENNGNFCQLCQCVVDTN